MFNGEIVQLTWLSHQGFVYHLNHFAPERTFTYSGEGSGLASDGSMLFLSDGTSPIRDLNPTTFREELHINVTDKGQPVTQLNELEIGGRTLCKRLAHGPHRENLSTGRPRSRMDHLSRTAESDVPFESRGSPERHCL